MSVPAQIAILLALTAGFFDWVALDRMTDAELAVREAVADIPDEVTARLATAEKLCEEDQATIIQITREALVRFQAEPELEAKMEVKHKPNAVFKEKT